MSESVASRGTASGTMTTDGHGNFVFDLALNDGIHSYFSGRFTLAVPAFAASVVMEFSGRDVLGGTYIIKAGSTVGKSTINIELTDDSGHRITITGGLTSPLLEREEHVMGVGSWAMSNR